MKRCLFLVCFGLLTAGRVAAQQPAETDERLVRAEAPIVAGNAVTAKKRALTDAFRQAVERAFNRAINLKTTREYQAIKAIKAPT